MVATADVETQYRRPLVALVGAADPAFRELKTAVDPDHTLPEDLLPGARTVISFFIPFQPNVPQANSVDRIRVAREWVVAYVETNALIDRITGRLVELLAARGVRAATQPATYNFDQVKLVSRWSHKSMAAVAGLGSFGLHHMLITDAGCAGRLGSLVIDAALPATNRPPRERCLYYHDGSCLECVMACPVAALAKDDSIDKHACWDRCQEAGRLWAHVGRADVCGKCATGPCATASAVEQG